MKYQNIRWGMLILLLLTLPDKTLRAQQAAPWHSFTKGRDNLIGYKDAGGQVRIPARFGGLTQNCLFRNIIPVTEGISNQSYYLLKSGKKAARDSLYVWDMTFDHEQEGKIRFRDPKTDQVGFLNKDGKAVIPALFNEASPFYNGLAVVIHHGRRMCSKGEPYNKKSPCEHWYWEGVTAIINAKGEILADSIEIEHTNNLNWYSLQVSPHPEDASLRVFFKGANHINYSFINYEKEFKRWFYQHYLSDLSENALQRNCFELLSAEGFFKDTLRQFYIRNRFISRYHTWIRPRLARIKSNKIEAAFFMDDLNTMIYRQPAFKSFCTDCGEANSARFPLAEVVLTYYAKGKKFDHQEHFSFLRTSHGYRLVGIAKP